MRNKRMFLFAVAIGLSIFAALFAISRTVIAQGSGRLQARSQIRTTAEPCACTPIKGDVLFIQDGPQQTLTMKLKGVTESDLYIHIDTNSFYDGTNSPVFPVAPLNRTNKKTGDWSRKLIGTNGAPPEFQVFGITNLSDMSDILSLVVGNPGVTNIIGGTNFIECTQTTTNGITETTCFTNIVGGATNILIDAFAWAPIPPLVSDASVFSFNKKAKLQLPAIPPSPKASGNMQLKYNGPTGASFLDFQASGLSKGQGYMLWLNDAGTNFNAGNFDVPKGGGGASVHYRRDTKQGDPLPAQAASTAVLTDRVFTIRDPTGGIHLIGSLP